MLSQRVWASLPIHWWSTDQPFKSDILVYVRLKQRISQTSWVILWHLKATLDNPQFFQSVCLGVTLLAFSSLWHVLSACAYKLITSDSPSVYASGCITSAESVLITQQSQTELYRILEANSAAPVRWKFNWLASWVFELHLQLSIYTFQVSMLWEGFLVLGLTA